MRGHPAVHNPEKNQGILHKIGQIVEQHVAKPAANQHTKEGSPNDEIGNFSDRDVTVTESRKPPDDEDSKEEGGNISEPVPAQAKIPAEAEKKGTKIVDIVGEHGRRKLLPD
jgi:hypothetical protein